MKHSKQNSKIERKQFNICIDEKKINKIKIFAIKQKPKTTPSALIEEWIGSLK